MCCQLLLFLILWSSQVRSAAHIRLHEQSISNSSSSSIQLYPQHWQSRNLSSRQPTRQVAATILWPNASYCEPTDFEHSYVLEAANASHILQLQRNHFPRTAAGQLATLRDLCLDDNDLPVQRLCIADNVTAQWQQLPQVTCRAGNQLSQELNQLRHLSHNKPAMLQQLSYLVSQAKGQLAAVDIYNTAQLVATLVQRDLVATMGVNLINICREIMSSHPQMLQLSSSLNATNLLLSKFESYLDALPQQYVPHSSCGQMQVAASQAAADNDLVLVNYAHIGVQALMSQTLSVFYVNPACQNITGIAIYATAASDRLSSSSGFWYRLLHAQQSVLQLQKETDLETAAYVPEQLWQQLEHTGASFLVFKVFAHDALFVASAKQPSQQPSSKVLSISIPGMVGQLPAGLPFLMRQKQLPTAASLQVASICGYWNYGSWLSDGVTTSSSQEHTTVLCHAQHLTQFSFLVGSSLGQLQLQLQNTPQDSLLLHEQLLDIITLVGCGLSLFGLLCIFLTAALVPSWRSQASTKILLHLCLALALQLVLFSLLSHGQLAVAHNWQHCLAVGAALQYSVLVIFSWMLIIAYLQFQRYVTVIGVARPQHYILISALVAWLVPLLPTLLLLLLDPESYKPSNYQLQHTRNALCYPSGYGLAWGVILPIALITVANAYLMIWIIYSVHRVLNPRREHITQQLRLSVLLFFLLGITWVFGLCTYMELGIIFSYLFCLTATLQGFVLFVYFVLLNTVNRSSWLRLVCPAKMEMDVPRRTTELQSMSSSSTNYSNRSHS